MDKRTMLITGAASGLGRSLAEQASARGHKLLLVDVSPDLAAVAQKLGAKQLVLDLAAPDAPERVAAFGEEADVLINNAGIGGRKSPFRALTEAEADRVVSVNVRCPMLLARIFLERFERRGRGALVNVASSVSYIATPKLALYGASKAFLLSFTEALLGERPGSGVQILAVCPAGMNTRFRAAAGLRDTPNPLSPDAVARRTLDLIEAGRSGVFNLGLGTLVFRMVGLLPSPLRIAVSRWLMERGL